MYKTVHGKGEKEFIEKKSRFIGSIKYCKTEEEAISFIQEIKDKYPDARHHVYAYIIGENSGTKRYSDDGEPQGTGGIPMLEVLKNENLTNVCVLGTRYFGGVLLGKGGLIRAYGKTAKLALETVEHTEVSLFREIRLTFKYDQIGKIDHFLQAEEIPIAKKEFLESVEYKIYIEEEKKIDFQEKLTNLTSGEIEFFLGEENFFKKTGNNQIIKV